MEVGAGTGRGRERSEQAATPREDVLLVWQKVSASVHRMLDGEIDEPTNKFEAHTGKDILATYKAITELATKLTSVDGSKDVELIIDPNLLAQTAEEIAAGRD